MDLRSPEGGLVSHGQGAGETLILDLVPKDKVVSENDLIVTAGRRSARLPSSTSVTNRPVS